MFLRNRKQGMERFVSLRAALRVYGFLTVLLGVGIALLSLSNGSSHNFILFLVGLILTMLASVLMTLFLFLLIGESEERDRLRELKR